MKIVCVDPQTDPLWRQLLDCSESSVFHSPGWIRVLNETYDFNIQAYVLLDERKTPKAGLPFCHIADVMGKRVVILPFSDYCDPLVNSSDQWNCLLEKLLAEHRPFFIRCIHNCLPLNDGRFTLTKQAKWHGQDLRLNLASIWGGVHESSKRAIKKARRGGIEVRRAQTEEELRAFFELHLKVRKYKYRLLAQPYRFFENLWREFVKKDSGVLLVAVRQGNIVGGIFFLAWRDTLYYKFNASSLTDLDYRPNDLLVWEGIQYGKTAGYSRLDFGLSDWDQEGLVRFKRKFASEEKTISFLRYGCAEARPRQEEEVRRLLPLITELLTDERVPDSITAKAGELLYRLFA